MPEIVVRYFGILREITGKNQEKISVNGSSTVFELISEMAKRNGNKFKDFVFDSHGKPRKSLAFAINGDSVTYKRLKSRKCHEISEFVILPPISGG